MKRFLLFVAVATLFAACSKNAIDEQQGIPNIVDEAPATLTVGFEDDETRIQLNEAQKTVWTNGDLVSVFYRSDANQKWQYTGETGARTADLTRVDAGEATTKTTRVVVVYPYNEDYYLNTEFYEVQAFMPATQTYLKDSYGLDGNIMISQSEYNNISLKNVCGWLKLQLTGNGEQVKSITVRGNNGEQVAGELYINSADATATLASDMGDVTEDEGENAGGAGGNLVFEDTVLKEVTLNCVDGTSPTEKGVTLGAEATAFYIALPPQTFTKGITVDITAVNGSTMTKSTDNEVVIERNHIKPMTALTFKATKPANNEIWYTATAKVEPYDKTVFGATYVSNEWDSETGKGVITFEGDVIEIGEQAFYNCDSLTSVTIGNSVTTIGEEAFSRCYSLTSVTIGDSVTTIGDYAFLQCYSLTSVTIPDSVTTIGYEAFYNCTSLKEFKGKFAADSGRCLIIDGVLNAFAIGCGATQYTIPDSVTTIGDYAFGYCNSLTSVTIGNSVKTIGLRAFSGCGSLTSVTIGNSVTTIGSVAFEGCSKLTSVTIPDSVTTIGEAAFAWCSSLKEFKGKFAADNGRCLIMDNTIIAYAEASGTTYTIPDSVTTIGNWAFGYCGSLTSVTIPDSVTTIRNCAFKSCSSLTSVTIPDSVTTIGQEAFSYCTSLKAVYCKRTTPPTGGSSMFVYNASGRKIYVPASDDDSIINAYKAKEYWKDYRDYIFEE